MGCVSSGNFGVPFELGDYCILVPCMEADITRTEADTNQRQVNGPERGAAKTFFVYLANMFLSFFSFRSSSSALHARRMAYSDNPHGHVQSVGWREVYSPFVEFISWAKVSSDFCHQRRSTIVLITWQQLLTLDYRPFFR
jgi:hypothetical protein